MGRPPHPEKSTRKNIALPDSIWTEIDAIRRTVPGRVPAEAEMVRVLVREALDARAKRAARKTK